MLAVVADAVTTPFEAMRRAALNQEDVAVIVGVGGLGGFGVQIAAAMGAAVVAIKLGDQGLYLRTTADAVRMGAFCERLALRTDAWLDRELLSPCFQARGVSGTTGSGDATVAGLLAALLRGAGPCEAATSATAVGACSVEAIDPISGIPTWTQVAERIAEGWPRHAVEIELPAGTELERDATGTVILRR